MSLPVKFKELFALQVVDVKVSQNEDTGVSCLYLTNLKSCLPSRL